MGTFKNYQGESYIKNSSSSDSFKRGKNMVLAKDVEEERKNHIKSWVTLFRNNISIFCEFYLEVPLFPYQRFWLHLMNRSSTFWAVASRASAKSWLIALYSIARCILYPGTIVSLNSSTKSQAGLIISEKCQQLYNDHPMIQRETKGITKNQNVYEMLFHSGSKIEVVISGEAGRGHRSNVSVLEERRLIPSEIIDSIIRPFLVRRMPRFLKNPEYSHLIDSEPEPQELVITSSYYKSHEWFQECKKIIKMVAEGDPDIRIIFLDYLISLKHGIKTRKQMAREKEKAEPISFLMEYGNIPFGSSASSFYKMALFNRSIKQGWRPWRLDDIGAKKNPYDIARKEGEKRIVSVDFAFRKGSINDNTIITCARLFPTKRGWSTEVCYIESHNGRNAILQALRIKQIYSEFSGFSDGDVLVLDIAGGGITVFDALTSITKDDVRGKEYDAMTVMKHASIEDKVYDELIERTIGQNAIPCIYPISASQSLNSEIAISFRDRLKRKLIKFLIDDTEEEEYLIRSGNKDIISQEDLNIKSYLLGSFVQTTLLVNECISLEMTMMSNGVIKLEEPAGGRKDRYTSVSYLNWYVASIMDKELLKEDGDTTTEELFLSLTQIV